MNKIKTLVIASLIFFSGTYLTNAQEVLSLSENVAKARIVAPLLLSATGSLDFGGIIVIENEATDVTLSTANVRSFIEGKARQITASRLSSSVPTFSLSGEVGLAYTITIPANSEVLVTLQSDGENATATGDADAFADNQQMFVNDFNYDLNGAPFDTSTSVSTSHTFVKSTTFKMGAKLKIRASQIKGDYSGTYTVTVAYD
jgi:hypothetical protein